LYFFPEGYLRTSGSEFRIDLKNIDNAYVHLTNNAVQKNSKSYGQYEDGNQLSFDSFQEYINEHLNAKVSVKDDLVPQMQQIVIKTFNAVRKQLDPLRRQHSFELFGYDFILDQEFNLWLIEVNTNPCLEESSKLLEMLLPRMIEDMMQITIDTVFPQKSI
jgi:D-alanine-D-alanine ligase-like ATP-grasp enzyme